MSLIPLDESTREWVILLEFIIAGSLIITKHTSDSQVLRSSIEYDAGFLTLRRSHMDGTQINCIISAIKWDLKLKVIPIILSSVGDFANKLGNMSVCLSTLLSRLLSLNQITVFYILVSLLSQACYLFLSN